MYGRSLKVQSNLKSYARLAFYRKPMIIESMKRIDKYRVELVEHSVKPPFC